MTAAPWMPGATVLDIGNHAPTDGGPAKAVAHVTWDKNATAAAPIALVPYGALVSYFGTNATGMSMAPHILWDPFTGGCTQFLPATSRALSLVDLAGGTRTNRAGSVVIQVEALFFPYCEVDGRVYPRLADTPCRGWAELHAWIRSWGVPDVWPMGRPTDFTPNRDESVWESRAGWYGHQQVPENTHQDPGSWPAFTSTPEPDMPITPADAELIVRTLLGTALAPVTVDSPAQSVAAVLGRSQTLMAAQAKQIAALSAAVTTLAGHVGSGADTATIVAAVQQAIAAAVIHVEVGSVPPAAG